MPRVIKRYGNRKLYDLDSSTYVTLHEIAEMVKAGEDIQVIDNRTKEDLTEVTLTQIILEEQKSQHSKLPLNFLKRIIQDSPFDELKGKAQAAVAPLKDAIEESERAMLKLLERGELTVEEAREGVKEIFQTPQRGLEEFQRRFDERFRMGVERITGFHQMQTRVRELEQKVTQLEHELSRSKRASRKRGHGKAAVDPADAADPEPGGNGLDEPGTDSVAEG